MKAPKKSELSTEEVIRIIETAAKFGASELQFGDLYVQFGRTAEQRAQEDSFMPQTAGQPPVAALTEQDHKALSKEALEIEQIRLRQEQMSMALIEDPEHFEELLRDGELSDDVDSADEDDE